MKIIIDEIREDSNGKYQYIEYDKFLYENVRYSEKKYLPTIQENRTYDLELLIDKANKVGDDVSIYQAELKALYDGTHDTYIQTKEQEAIDNFTIELLESGVL